MIRAIVGFELGRRFRAISTWVYFVLFGALAGLLMVAGAGGLAGASVNFGAGGKVLVNSPFAVANLVALLGYFGLLVIGAVMGRAAYQDFECRIDPLIFTSRVSKTSYLLGRFTAAVIVLLVIFSSLSLGLWIGTLMPGLDQARLGQNHLITYIMPYATSVIPNILILGAFFFCLAALSRRIFPVYMASVLLLEGFLIAGTISRKVEHKWIAALVDPFGSSAFGYLTEYWTIFEKNARVPGLEGFVLWNRLLWLAVVATLGAIVWWRFRMGHAAARSRASTVSKSESKVSGGITARLPLLIRMTLLQFTETVKNVYFGVIVLAGLGFMIANARTIGSMYGTNTYPVTYQVLELVGGTFSLFLLIIITFYSGELAWRERDAGVHEIVDSLPISHRTLFLSKLFALFLVQVLLEAVVMAGGVAIQAVKGYARIEPELYLKSLFGIQLIDYWLICVLALAVHVIVNNKYLGHFVMVIYYLTYAFMGEFGLEHHLYNYGSHPDYTYSDMNRFGPFLPPLFWFFAYWTALAIVLAVGTYLLWVRGLAADWRSRLRLARERFGRPQQAIAVFGAIAFGGLGWFIWYNTTVQNIYRVRTEDEKLQVRMEKEYKNTEHSPHPMITGVSLRVNLDPAKRHVRVYGHYEVTNKFDQPIQQFLVTIPENMRINQLRFTPGATLVKRDRMIEVDVWRMKEPWAPGATGGVDFDIEWEPHGFPNGGAPTTVVENGTFLNSESLPHFGYDAGKEIGDDDTRRKYGLKPKERVADINDMAARRFNYISNDADWVDFDAVISTSLDQTAIAPGELAGSWREDGHRLFHYRTRGPILGFFSVLSARYQVLRDRWNDVDLEVYYHPGHEYNLAQMIKGMKQTLDYASRNFSPYQNRTLRIVEFPRYASFAQSFPATIPYSESIGFIAKVDNADEEDVDYPFYVTAHEVAHQWWAHQVIGGNVQGATLMSESLAQYTALMVMKQEYGPEHMKRFLKYEMDRYLSGRSSEKKQELPLIRCEGQGYIRYQKASVVFYALQDYIGEDAVNQALREYLKAVAFQQPPYTNALELEAKLRAVTPPQYAYIIDDMFDSVTLYENRALDASYRDVGGGNYEVKLKVAVRKLKANDQGEEREVPLSDWIDIGIFDEKDKPLYMQRQKVDSKEEEFTLMVHGIPAKAGIDPWNKLVDRSPGDNTTTVKPL